MGEVARDKRDICEAHALGRLGVCADYHFSLSGGSGIRSYYDTRNQWQLHYCIGKPGSSNQETAPAVVPVAHAICLLIYHPGHLFDIDKATPKTFTNEILSYSAYASFE
jgi:hypothetical protein